jgi:fatty-acyl-CoA synthase
VVMGVKKIDPASYAFNYQLLIKNLLITPLLNAPEQEIVYLGKVRITYMELNRRIHRLANALTKLGVKPGNTVAVMDYDSHRYLECFFAVPMLGAVLHTINVRLSPEQILYTMGHAEDDVLLIHSDFLPILEQIKGRLDVKKYIILNDTDVQPKTHVEFSGEYEAILASEPDHFDFPEFDENTIATTFYTTGTTGLPKGVYFTHRQLVLHTLSTLSALGMQAKHGRFHRESVYMPLTPMFHVHAWGIPYVATLMGVKQVYPGRYIPEHILDLIENEKVTFSHCVPTMLHMLLKTPRAEKMDLSKLTVIIGGAALPKSLCAAALKRGIDVFAGYGMSETCPVLTLAFLKPGMDSLSIDQQAETLSKTGIPIPMVDLRIVDDHMNDLPHDGKTAGEIVVRAPWLTQGYLKDVKSSEKLWAGGYLHTNDMAQIDPQEYVKITDRTKDVIKIGGEWVSSLELEDIISSHHAVSDTAVIGMPDDKWGERPLALVVLKQEHQGKVTEKEILHHMMEYMDKGVIGKQVVLVKTQFVDMIDKTSVGKVNKVVLRQKYLAQ